MRVKVGNEIIVMDDAPDAGVEIPAPPTAEDRIAALEEQNEMLTECILELSELLYA